MKKQIIYISLALVSMSCSRNELTKNEIDEVAMTQENYRKAWLNNDSSAVLSTLTSDIILFPPGTSKNVAGKSAVKGFWFPNSDTTFVIQKFEVSEMEILGSGAYATFTGVSDLSWDTVTKDSVIAQSSSKSQFISIMLKIHGEWKIHRQMWNVKK